MSRLLTFIYTMNKLFHSFNCQVPGNFTIPTYIKKALKILFDIFNVNYFLKYIVSKKILKYIVCLRLYMEQNLIPSKTRETGMLF